MKRFRTSLVLATVIATTMAVFLLGSGTAGAATDTSLTLTKAKDGGCIPTVKGSGLTPGTTVSEIGITVAANDNGSGTVASTGWLPNVKVAKNGNLTTAYLSQSAAVWKSFKYAVVQYSGRTRQWSSDGALTTLTVTNRC